MSDFADSVAPLLFWTLAAVALIAPPRWALFSYLLLAQVDLSASDFASASTLGLDNAFRIVVIPTVLLLRLRSTAPAPAIPDALSRWWLLFAAYVAIASFWSPFPLSAIKMIGYLYCYSALFILFRRAWAQSWFSIRFVIANLGAALCIATAQTYVLGDLASPEGRLTSFDDPQNFAAYLISIAAIVLFARENEKGALRWFALAAAAGGIVLTGSRYVLIGLVMLAVLSFLRQWFEQGSGAKLSAFVKRIVFVAAATLLLVTVIVRFAPENRLNELVDYAGTSSSSYEDVGTFAWRVLIYEEAIDQILNRTAVGLLFGSGTSSAGGVKVDVYSHQFTLEEVDANRSMHDEFLRAVYEWGIVGLVLLLGFLGSTFSFCWRRAKATREVSTLAYIALFPTLLLGLGVENILANAGHPAGTGYLLVFTFSAAAPAGARSLLATARHPMLAGGMAPNFPAARVEKHFPA
jgi:O-Antigen ligase